MKQFFLFAACALALGGLASSPARAQNPTTGGPSPQQPADVPLDGGASLLAASGVAYGLRYLRQRRKPAQ